MSKAVVEFGWTLLWRILSAKIPLSSLSHSYPNISPVLAEPMVAVLGDGGC